MAAGDITEGTRVETINDLHRPGDYCVRFTDTGDVSAVWMILPSGEPDGFRRIPAEGHGAVTAGRREPEWRVTLEQDGTVTVSPSLLDSTPNGSAWHGYLERGVWREV